MIKNTTSKTKIILCTSALILLAIMFVLPVRCTSIAIYPGMDGGDVKVSAFRGHTCTSIYRKEFWMDYDLLSRNVEFIFGFSSLTEWWGTGTYRQFSGDVHETIIHHSYPADYSNNSILIGASQNVFIGRVVAIVGNKDFMGSPATQFSLEIIKNIKGDTSGTVVINQEGGYRDGVLYLAEEDGKMLQPGSTYLLATRYDSDGDYYTLNPHPNASKLLNDDASLEAVQLQSMSEQDVKVKSLESAYAHEKLLDADIAHGNTRNSFQSLAPAEKAAAQSRADAARASLDAMQQGSPAVQ